MSLSPFVAFIVLFALGYDDNADSIPFYLKVLSVWAALSVWILFFWMVFDLIKRKDLEKKGYWGISFFLAGPFAVLLYLPFSFIPRVRREIAGNLPEEKYKPKRPDGFTLIALYLVFTGLCVLINIIITHHRNYPGNIITNMLILIISVTGSYGLWNNKSWSDKIMLIYVIMMMIYMAVFQFTIGGLPFWQFAVAFIVFSVPLLLMYRYVRIKVQKASN